MCDITGRGQGADATRALSSVKYAVTKQKAFYARKRPFSTKLPQRQTLKHGIATHQQPLT